MAADSASLVVFGIVVVVVVEGAGAVASLL